MLTTDLIEGLKIPFQRDIKHYTVCIKRQDDDLWVSEGPPPSCQCMEQKGARCYYGLYLQLFKLTLI